MPPKKPFTTIPFAVPEMESLDIMTLNLVAEMAKGMSRAEILEAFSCEWEDLDKFEQAWFTKFFNFGKAGAVKEVISNLIEISRKNPAAGITFLKQQSKTFEGAGEASGSGSETFSFTFGSKAGSVPDLKVIK